MTSTFDSDDSAAPWAMQLAARVEKSDPPSVSEIGAAAAKAVIALIAADRAGDDAEWARALDTWQGSGRIRKLVRRARGAAWDRAQEPAGRTARVGAAEVRAYIPTPMDAVPEAVRKLQIQSTPLASPEVYDALPGAVSLIIAVTPSVEMSWGKVAAQCAHAGQVWWRDAGPTDRRRWDELDRPITVVHASPTLWSTLVPQASVQIRDGGFTEIPAGTLTTLALWPSR